MGATKVHGRYSCFCFISTPKHIPIHYHTVDGCEILHQLVDDNPMIYTVSCFIVTNSYAGWWFGFRVAIHSFVMRLWKTTVRANVPSPFVWGLDLKVLLVPDMTLDFRLWHGISKEELAVLSIYWGTLRVFFFLGFWPFPRALPGRSDSVEPWHALWWSLPSIAPHRCGGGYICLWGSLGETYATFEP